MKQKLFKELYIPLTELVKVDDEGDVDGDEVDTDGDEVDTDGDEANDEVDITIDPFLEKNEEIK